MTSCTTADFVCCSINAPPTAKLYTLSLHDALPIYIGVANGNWMIEWLACSSIEELYLACLWQIGTTQVFFDIFFCSSNLPETDRKSTRLNSSHVATSYAVFCLKKKKSLEATNSHTK